jgi:DNA-binding LytR/AlgR family response regulator
MYIAVCDDQLHELDSMICLLDRWRVKRDAAMRYKVFHSAVELLEAAEKEHFTLYLLDVMMPGMDGMAAAREIRSFNETAEIVFLTSSPDFAYASYGVRALDYLLKPILPEKLYGVLDRILFRENKPQDGFLLKSGATLIRVPFSQLSHVEVINKHLYYHLSDGTVREVSGRLKDCESLLLARPEFKRIHRSFIVNLLAVTELSPATVKTATGKLLPVSRGLYHDLQKDYVDLLFSRGETP